MQIFTHFATWVARMAGSAWAFLFALSMVLLWFAAGPLVGFGNTLYQLSINTGTTIVTFLMVFLIQHAQNRDTQALQVKLDALLEALAEAPSRFSGIEDKDQDSLQRLQSELNRPGAEDAG